MPGAVRPFHRLEERNNGQPTDIRLRLMEGADIYQIAGNCRTSVEMIERVYALHIKATLDAAAINVRKARPDRPMSEPPRRPCGTLMRGRPVAVLVRQFYK
ncbi:MAG: hypothetical protein ACAH24_21605 [Hyphomicrobiaceae bacterium]|jgi:hypothetical protein